MPLSVACERLSRYIYIGSELCEFGSDSGDGTDKVVERGHVSREFDREGFGVDYGIFAEFGSPYDEREKTLRLALI